jgi:hypothetical protein
MAESCHGVSSGKVTLPPPRSIHGRTLPRFEAPSDQDISYLAFPPMLRPVSPPCREGVNLGLQEAITLHQLDGIFMQQLMASRATAADWCASVSRTGSCVVIGSGVEVVSHCFYPRQALESG